MPSAARAPGAGEPAAPNGTGDGNAEAPPAPLASSDAERQTFFAAFRAAAERAREEAGIDDRRVGH
jgi:hypothetical protein